MDGGLESQSVCHSTGDTAFTTALTYLYHPLLYVFVFCLWRRKFLAYIFSILGPFSTCAGEELLEVVQSNAHMLWLCLLRIEWIAFVLNSHSIDDLWWFRLCMFVTVWVLSGLVCRSWHGDRARVEFYLEFSLFLYDLVIVWVHRLARNLVRISSTWALSLESLRDLVVLNTQSER